MPFAFENGVSTDEKENSIAITDEQYLEAIIGMQQGMSVTIAGGFKVSFLMYGRVGTNDFRIGGGEADGWIVIKQPRPEDEKQLDYTLSELGQWEITEETLFNHKRNLEIAWQAEEMAVIADQRMAIEEEDPKALPGTDSQWLQYRTKVRNWKEENFDFPDSTKRPKRPT